MEDRWKVADVYECFMGRWSDSVAGQFVEWLAVEDSASWLDVGCGTGALSAAIVERAHPSSVAAVDPSTQFVAGATGRLGERVDVRTGSADELPFGVGEFDVTVSGLALNFFPEPAVGIREMARVTRSGGVVAAYVWDYADGMEMLRHFWNAATTCDPQAAPFDEATRFSMCRPDALVDLFTGAGLTDCVSAAVTATTKFSNFDDFWEPFLGGQGPAPSYLATLDSERQLCIADALRGELPIGDDGAISLTARAWAITAMV